MRQKSIPNKLPKFLYKFFWDTEAKKVNPARHPEYVINRLLDKGDLKAARWVVKNFSEELIKKTLRTSHDFSPWNGRFWANYYQMANTEIACLNPHYLKQRRDLWPH